MGNTSLKVKPKVQPSNKNYSSYHFSCRYQFFANKLTPLGMKISTAKPFWT